MSGYEEKDGRKTGNPVFGNQGPGVQGNPGQESQGSVNQMPRNPGQGPGNPGFRNPGQGPQGTRNPGPGPQGPGMYGSGNGPRMQGYPGGGPGNGSWNQGPGGPQRMPVQRKPMSRKNKITVVLVVLVVVALGGLYAVLNHLSSPEYVAEKYFEAYLAKDWDAVYDRLDIPDGPFMTKEHFLALHTNDEKESITNLKVQEETTSSESISEMLGDLEGKLSAGTEGFMRQFAAYYTIKGESQPSRAVIQLMKQKEKSFLFFPKWKVTSGDLLQKNFQISSPPGYQLVLDGETLTPTAEASEESGGYDMYLVNLFTGEHTVESSAANRESGSATFNSYNVSYYEVDSLPVSQEAVSNMQEIVQAFMRQVYVDALADAGASSEYLSYWSYSADAKESATKLYERLRDRLKETYYDKIQFTSMNFSNYNSRVGDDYSDEEGVSYVNLYTTYNYDYSYTATETSYQGITSKEEIKEDGDDEVNVTFCLENEEWKIAYIDMYSVY